MNLKELIIEVEWCINQGDETALMWMRKVVEAVDDMLDTFELSSKTDIDFKKSDDNIIKGIGLLDDWQKLKELLGLKQYGTSK